MNGERAKLIIKLILGIAAIAVCCLFIIFVMRACSAGDDDPDASNTPSISDDGESSKSSGNGSGTGVPDDTLSSSPMTTVPVRYPLVLTLVSRTTSISIRSVLRLRPRQESK